MNELTRNQFDVLSFLESVNTHISQRDIATSLKKSLGLVNKILAELNTAGFITSESETISEKGLRALEPYRVKRAIIIAAGFSSRLAPVTLNTPKPLVRVHGKRIIDYLLDAIVAAEIKEIYIIRGYLGEQFDQLLANYPFIHFLENPLYNESNNISSMLVARDFLENAYVCEADLIPHNLKLITKYQYTSNYLAVPVDKTDDWCFYDKNGIINRISIGGKNCWQMIGISYWNECDGRKLSHDIKEVFDMPGGKERFWDQVALEYHIKDYKVSIRSCKKDDVIEIDTFSELKKIDPTYRC
jgi:CTP:phosphocholine cytidylyltransferase-like protein